MKAVLVESPLWWHLRGLQQTASGYGRKLATAYMLDCEDGKRRRLYCCCFSNSGTVYALVRGVWFHMDEYNPKPGDTVTLAPLRAAVSK